MPETKEGYSKENYAKSYFTPKNILIYIVVYGLVYYLFVVKQGGYNPNMYNIPTSTPVVTQIPVNQKPL
mgnify:CR=1 FL=1